MTIHCEKPSIAPSDLKRASVRSVHHRRTTCRGCGQDELVSFLNLGTMPLANAFLSTTREFADEPRFPLEVFLCEHCSLVQLLDVIDPEVLFRHYLYQTGFSATIAAHNERLTQLLVQRLGLGQEDLVVEIASNDGSLLKCFRQAGTRTLGIEPAANLARKACEEGLETVNLFFRSAIAGSLLEKYGPAKVVIGNNVLAHVDEPCDFLQGVRQILHREGLGVFEFPYLGDFIDRLEYDTVYHEHLSYFSVTAILHLCEKAGLSVVAVDRLPVHGGSLRIYTARSDAIAEHGQTAKELAAFEQTAGLTGLGRLREFASQVEQNRIQLTRLLHDLHTRQQTLAGYGAAAKGNTLLNYCGIDPKLISFIVDKNPLKQGLYTPGTHIPVLPVSALLERQPDYVLILPWNLADEICAQQALFRQRGGRFIVPIPEPTVI